MSLAQSSEVICTREISRHCTDRAHIYLPLMEDIMHTLQCQAGQGREKRFDE